MFCFNQTIMKDRWINMGLEDHELKPYKEPSKDILDSKRIGKHSGVELTHAVYLFCCSGLSFSIS